MHVVPFIFSVCVCVCVAGLQWVNIVLKNALSARGGGDDHEKTDGNQSAFLSHSSLLAPTPYGLFYLDLWGVWRLALQLKIWGNSQCSIFSSSTKLQLHGVAYSTWSLISLKRSKNWIGETSAAPTSKFLFWPFSWASQPSLHFIYDFSAEGRGGILMKYW